MATLFGRDKSTISRHIKNIFEEGELELSSVIAKFATTATDGNDYQVDYYNLDIIISVDYKLKYTVSMLFLQLKENGQKYYFTIQIIIRQYRPIY